METNIKQLAKQLIDQMPENVSWENIIHEFYVRESIEEAIKESESGQMLDVSEVRKKFGLQ